MDKKIWTKEEIKNLLITNKNMVIKSLIKLYENQTYDEQVNQTTKEYNGVGFNGCDALIMTSIAQFYIKKGFMTEKQFNIVKKKIVKYAGQLTKIANGTI